jgi:hypothetical protein
LFDSAEETEAAARLIARRHDVRAIAVPTAPPLIDDLHVNALSDGA